MADRSMLVYNSYRSFTSRVYMTPVMSLLLAIDVHVIPEKDSELGQLLR